jgi:KUP system potassium uptake protein
MKLERYLSTDMKPTNKGVRNFLERSGAAKLALKIIGVVGVALIMAGRHLHISFPCPLLM